MIMNAFDRFLNGVFGGLLKMIGILFAVVGVLWVLRFGIGLVRDILGMF